MSWVSASELKVTVISTFGGTAGGAEQWLASVLAHSRGLRVRAIILEAGPLADVLAAQGAEILVLPTGSSARDMANTARLLLADLRAHRPEVIVANGVKAMAAVAGPAVALGIPRVWVKHDHSFDASLARPLGRIATKVIATALEVGMPTRREDLVVIEPERPADPESRSSALAALAHLGYTATDQPTCAIIGRLVPYKGVDVGIASLAYDPARRWRLVVIGAASPATPDELERLTALAADLGVIDRVDFLGSIPGAGRLVSAFDALAVLTRPGQPNAPDREGYGITATEAMLGGIPVVIAGPGPVARRLQTPAGPAGIMVAQADPCAVAEALAALTDPDSRLKMGQAGRKAALLQPDAQQVADEFVGVLRTASRR